MKAARRKYRKRYVKHRDSLFKTIRLFRALAKQFTGAPVWFECTNEPYLGYDTTDKESTIWQHG